MQPLRELGEPLIDLSGPWPWLGLQSGFDALFPKGGLYYWKSSALAELTEAAIDEIADFAARRPTPLTDLIDLASRRRDEPGRRGGDGVRRT